MPSALQWLDFSEHERRRITQVIELFQERGTVDELGIGTVRDAVADSLFPGTSVLHTRARYMLFIPWLYQKFEEKRTSSAEIAGAARRREIDLVRALLESLDTDGVIGKQAQEGLRQLPSAAYWHGLGRWGIRQFDGSQSQYHRSLNAFYRRLDTTAAEPGTDGGMTVPSNWHPRLPPRPKNFPGEAQLPLPRAEAEFLRDLILRHAPETLLAFLVDDRPPVEAVAFCWQYAGLGEMPTGVRRVVDHAQCLSEVMHGAALLYNLLLSRARKRDDWVHRYEDDMGAWVALIEGRHAAIARWDQAAFWELVRRANPRIRDRTRQFISSWIQLALGSRPADLVNRNEAVRLIVDRERAMKGALARLQNPRALDLYLGRAGANQLDFRWGVVQRIVVDIQRGLQADA